MRELFTVEYEGPTVTEDGVETLLASGAKLRRVRIDYEAARRVYLGADGGADGFDTVEEFVKAFVGAALVTEEGT